MAQGRHPQRKTGSDPTPVGARSQWLTAIRLALPLGWVLVAVGYFGPWIAHETAALTLNGPDMAEFIKFLPEVMSGSLETMRQVFYLPAFATVASALPAV